MPLVATPTLTFGLSTGDVTWKPFIFLLPQLFDDQLFTITYWLLKRLIGSWIWNIYLWRWITFTKSYFQLFTFSFSFYRKEGTIDNKDSSGILSIFCFIKKNVVKSGDNDYFHWEDTLSWSSFLAWEVRSIIKSRKLLNSTCMLDSWLLTRIWLWIWPISTLHCQPTPIRIQIWP